MKRTRIFINARGARRLGVRRGWATATIRWAEDRWFATDIRRGSKVLDDRIGLSSTGWRQTP